MDKPRRDSLRRVIGEARRTVEDSLGRQLVAYGLFTASPPLPRAELPLRPDQETHYGRVLDAVRRQGRAVGSAGEITPAAVARFVREAGGTWINRLAALRALEARGLLEPAAASVGEEYGGLSPRGMQLRERAAQDGIRLTPDEALRRGVEDACQELSDSVRVLFDTTDEQSLFWPDARALREILRSFSAEVTHEDWAQPDVLGWVYQYYNTEANAELKRRKARTTGFKYRPDDIPVANQFYTPPWVVRVLTDNTLGRLWLEMQDRLPRLERSEETRDGKTVARHRLRERRDGVPHAAEDTEAFRAWIAEEPDFQRDGTVDRLCRFLVPLPSEAVPRVPKSVREIRVLDPACGSGHFLLYAFDVLFAMYREAEPDLDPRAIPALILEHNLFGIDIDLRAAQLAAFDLYLKARATLATIDLGARLELRGLNIVVADAHIGNDPRKAAFLERYRQEPEIRALYAKVLSDLDHTNALGSLIKVRTEFEALFGRIRQARARQASLETEPWPGPRQGVLIETSPQLDLRDTYRGQSGRTWTINDLLAELRAFEAEVAPSQDVGARLFYTDLERAVGLLGLLSEQYDVVLMNPPYGDMPPETKDYLKGNKKRGIPAHYPRTHGDLFAAFIEQALDLTLPNGFVGGLLPWTYMFLSSMEQVRTEILCGQARPELLQEYGYGILDGATVGTVATIARKLPSGQGASVLQHACVFNRLSEGRKDWEKYDKLIRTYPVFCASGPDPGCEWFVARLGSFQDVPGMPYAYWANDSLRRLFRDHAALDCDSAHQVASRPRIKVADVKFGLSTKDNARFLRFWWETLREKRGRGRRWCWMLKGGQYNYFCARVDHVVLWEDDGRELKEWASMVYGKTHWSRTLQGHTYYFKPGITYNRRSWKVRPFGLVGPDHIYSDNGPGIIPVDVAQTASILGLLSSSLLVGLRLMQLPERMIEVASLASLPVATPVPKKVGDYALQLEQTSRRRLAGDETCRDFTEPDLRRIYRGILEADASTRLDLTSLLEAWLSERTRVVGQEAELLGALDEEVYRLYDIAPEDRALIERQVARRPRAEWEYSPTELDEPETTDGEESSSDDGADENGEADENFAESLGEAPVEVTPAIARDLVARWISFYVKQVVEGDADGIVVLDAIHGEPALVIRVREAIELDLGKEAAHALVTQTPKYLGTADLAEWLAVSREDTIQNGDEKQRRPVGFFPWHVVLYHSRPIFWLVSSEGFERGRTRLTLRAYLHYLKLTPDTLPRLVAYYVDPTVGEAERQWSLARDEAGRLEGRARTAANARADEWANTVDALKRFRDAVEGVIRGPAQAERVPERAKWLSRTIAQVRGGRDLGQGYRPDIDYGVRVNIPPLVEQRLLSRAVLKRLAG